MIKAGIIGATGYTGVELVRLLGGHPGVRLEEASSHSYAGQPFSGVYPDKTDLVDLVLSEQDAPGIMARNDVVFLALPHGHGVSVARAGLAANTPVIDLGADFRFADRGIYEQWYGVEHTGEDILPHARYCLPEINRQEVPGTRIVGNPGCYPTSVILGLAPLLEEKLVDPTTLVIDSKSGVSGAGRKTSLTTHFAEVNDSVSAYGLGTHRHTPEIEGQLGKIWGGDIRVSFTPHLMPMTRGILSTMVVGTMPGVTEDRMRNAFEERYREEPFVHLLAPGVYPKTRWVYGSNHCQINLKLDERTGRVIVVSVIDNLVKGAAGQAIQNMNLLFGQPETAGLEGMPLVP